MAVISFLLVFAPWGHAQDQAPLPGNEIHYLLGLIEHSSLSFERNGQKASGKDAAKLLRAKLNQNKNKVHTTEDFIEIVASFSNHTKKSYYVILPEGKRTLLKDFLYAELKKLRNAMPTAVVFVPSVLFAEEGKTVTVVTKDRYTFASGVNHMPGKVSVNQSDLYVKYETKAFKKLPVDVSFEYKHLDINEDIPVGLPASLHGRRFLVGTKFPVPFFSFDKYFIGVDVMPSWYSDNASFTANAFRLPFRTYLIYKPSETFVLIAGVQVDVKADTPVVPIIGFNYRPNDRLDIHLASTEPTITYKLDDHWAVFAEYDATLDEYVVTRAGQKGVVFKVREAIFGGGFKFKVNGWLDTSLSAGLNTGRRFSYGDNAGKVDVHSAPYIKFRFSMKF